MLLRSTDRGKRWSVAYRALTTLSSVTAARQSLLVLLSDSDAVAESTDDGKTWQSEERMRSRLQTNPLPPTPSPLPAGVLSICTLDSSMFACGEPGLLYISHDSMHSWQCLHSAAFADKKSLQIDFASRACGIISTEGNIYYTNDSALTWQESSISVAKSLTRFPALMLGERSWLVGVGNAIASTNDAGATYLYDTLPTSRTINSLTWRDKTFEEISIVTDSALYIAKPTDIRSASVGWSLPSDTNQHVLNAGWPNRYVGFVLVDSSSRKDTSLMSWDGLMRDTTVTLDTCSLYRTTDGGASWSAVLTATASLTAVACANGQRVFVCGERGAMLKSEDTGRTWSRVRTPTSHTLLAVRFLNDSTGFASGDSGTVLSTSSMMRIPGSVGRWWRSIAPEAISTNVATPYTSIAFADAHTMYVAGDGKVWRQTIRDPMPRIIWRGGRQEAQRGTLKVYPNPASNVLHVEGASAPVSVQDEFGQGYSTPGKNGAIDIASLPPGVYYITDGQRRARFVKE